MQVCKESTRCEFFQRYAQLNVFRKEHYHYFCFGPLAETCARRVYLQEKGFAPRADYTPTGSIHVT